MIRFGQIDPEKPATAAAPAAKPAKDASSQDSLDIGSESAEETAAGGKAKPARGKKKPAK